MGDNTLESNEYFQISIVSDPLLDHAIRTSPNVTIVTIEDDDGK